LRLLDRVLRTDSIHALEGITSLKVTRVRIHPSPPIRTQSALALAIDPGLVEPGHATVSFK
jgi:hypothetical protein